MKILIVDDNVSITEMLSEYLIMQEHDVSMATSGRNGLSMIQNNGFDAILLDLSMPEFTGMDIIAALEKDDQLKDKRIILFTASSISNETLEGLLSKEGVQTCLKKPVKLAELLQTITAS